VPAADPIVNVRTAVPDAVLDVRYATARNFLGRAVYSCSAAFLKRSTAAKLSEAARALRAERRRLVIYDAYRPLSVQKLLWAARPDSRFVADPARGSAHNRGGAVDAGLADMDGRALAMPSDFDEFGPRAAHGALGVPDAARAEAERLKAAMTGAGFQALAEEWWHYQDAESAAWPLLDLPFEGFPA
jgi:D-alanyl-D-alanine dipeptidase